MHQPSKQKQMLQDLTDQGGIILFLNKNSSLYAIEGSEKLTNYLTTLLKKDHLKYLAGLKPAQKPKFKIKSHYQELLKEGWKDYELCLLEAWKDQEKINIQERLAYYHTKYQPKLNLFRYVSTNGKIAKVYQWNRFRTEEQRLATGQKRAATKPLVNYRIDDKSPVDKLKGKVYYENKRKIGIYRWVNRDTKQSYIGSTLNLGQILYTLDSNSIADDQQVLYLAMRKYDLTSFNLQILAHCSKEELAEKEQYYLDLYQPEYNIFKVNSEEQPITVNPLSQLPISMIEFNTFNQQLVLFKPPRQSLMISNSFPNLSLIAWEVKPVYLLIREIPAPVAKVRTKKTWTLSEATRLKQSLAQQKRTKHPKPGFAEQVLDLSNNTTTVYSSIREASRALNILEQTISIYLKRNQTKPHKKRYVFTKVLGG